MSYKIIGAGGIGSHLVSPLCRYLDNVLPETHIVIIDGDQYEEKNADRQIFANFGNKAEVTRDRLRQEFPRLAIDAKAVYITEANAFVYIEEGDVVFSCVDNHASRRVLSEHAKTLANVTIFSGGNELLDGNVQVYVRRGGQDITPPLTHLHPEIANPRDHNPDDMSCEELVQAGSSQLIFTNLTAASAMLNAFYLVHIGALPYTEVYFDLSTGASRPVNRKGK